MQKIVIVDFGMGNLHSVAKAVNCAADANTKVVISTNSADILSADKVILPGQGAIAGCMANIEKYELTQALLTSSKQKPLLAICVGPQLLMQHSEENDGVAGLGIFKGNCKKFSTNVAGTKYKIPHIGWNTVQQTCEHPMWKNIANGAYFYFVHSYYLLPDNKENIMATTDYGIEFTAAMAADNIFTMQCHPEKSAAAGLQLFKNFVNWDV